MLIKCPDCGKEISDQAQSCIHCGRPIKQQKSRLTTVQGVALIAMLLVGLAASAIGVYLYVDCMEFEAMFALVPGLILIVASVPLIIKALQRSKHNK